MQEALNLAKKGLGRTAPNPCVGAVLVKEGRVVGRGFHERAGRNHAEISAIENAGTKARGATLYVTLEPCSTFGKTPPCVPAIVQAGIRRVVIGASDPNPQNASRGIRLLSRKRIATVTGILKNDAENLNRAFKTWIEKERPYVTVKVAQSIDGKIATSARKSQWITSKASRQRVQELRSQVDAILVGIGTVLLDDPRLNVRGTKGSSPLKVVVDSTLRIPQNARLFKTKGKVLIATTKKSSSLKRKRLSKKAEVLVLDSDRGKVSVKSLLEALARRGVLHVLAEGGGEMIASLVEAGLCDEAYVFVAPKIIGGRDAVTSVEGRGILDLKKAVSLKNTTVQKIGNDFLIHGTF